MCADIRHFANHHAQLSETVMQDSPIQRLDPELIARYDVSGPRYTSYPTAVQFTDQFDEKSFARAVGDSNGAPIPAPLSIYVHVPFCRQLCFYCACNKLVTQDTAKAVEYLDLLEREAQLHSKLVDPDREVRQLHLGGGSPTFLDDAQLERLIGILDQYFKLNRQGEWSIEIDPRTVTVERMKHLAKLGFNRVSFGVQDINEAVQAAVNRVQSLEETRACIQAARDVGMKSVSVDLIYGLPLQTLESYSETLDEVERLVPDRIAIYNYAHLPERFKAQRLIQRHQLPSAETKLSLQELIRERLLAAGYVHIGMDHYAKPDDELVNALHNGSLQRNFQGYSTHAECEMIGMGVSSISAIGNSFAQNSHRLPEYRERVLAGHIPIIRGLHLSEDDQVRAQLISQIMCQMKIDKDDFLQHFGVEFDRYFERDIHALEHQLKQMQDDGLLEPYDTGYRVSETGRYFLRNVAMCFDRYNQASEKFSKVI
jgi:oxygen-independent coproporphyrinogen-3 oxidase